MFSRNEYLKGALGKHFEKRLEWLEKFDYKSVGFTFQLLDNLAAFCGSQFVIVRI